MDGFEGSYCAPVALSGASNGEFELAGGGTWTPQAALYSNPNAHIHFRVLRETGQAAQTLANSSRALSQLGALEIKTAGTVYVYWFLCDASGNAVAAGANDRVLRSKDQR